MFWGPLKVYVQRICNLVQMLLVISSTTYKDSSFRFGRLKNMSMGNSCLSFDDIKNNYCIGNEECKWFVSWHKWFLCVISADSSFHLDRVKNIAAMGNSCFWLAKILLIFSESTSSNGLLIGANYVFGVFCKHFSFHLQRSKIDIVWTICKPGERYRLLGKKLRTYI